MPTQSETLQALRAALGFSVYDVATVMDVSLRTAARILAGRQPLSRHRADKLVAAARARNPLLAKQLERDVAPPGVATEPAVPPAEVAALVLAVAENARLPARRFAQALTHVLATTVERAWPTSGVLAALDAIAPREPTPAPKRGSKQAK